MELIHWLSGLWIMAQDIPCHYSKQGCRYPSITGFVVSPEDVGVYGGVANEAVGFQGYNPACVDADGNKEVSGSLKGARQNESG